MTTKIAEVLEEVVPGVLESMAFMFSEPADPKEGLPDAEGYLGATMSFDGPAKGRIGVVVAEDWCDQLAEGILGEVPEEESDPDMRGDALCELLNIICGQFITSLWGTDEIFDLSIPTVSEVDQTAWDNLSTRPGALRLVVEDLPMIVYAEAGVS